MELIINISEQEYNECKNLFNMVYQEGYLNYNLNTSLIMYIANGTPLPKKHGRLIDESKITEAYIERIEGEIINGIKIPIRYIINGTNAPTIIESDKGE